MSWFSNTANALWTMGGNLLLNAFGEPALPTATRNPVADPAGRVTAALDGRRWNEVADLYDGTAHVPLTADLRRRIEAALLGSNAGRQALAARPRLAGAVLSAADPEALRGLNLADCFEDATDDVMAAAVLAISRKHMPQGGEALDRDAKCDPARFSLLALQISPDQWNDTGGGLAPKRGLGPTVCGQLWGRGNYDGICELIDAGVDTSTSAPYKPGMVGKQRGGRIQPIQHVVSPLLKNVAELAPVGDPRTEPATNPVEGARKILAALTAKGGAVTLTSYAAVQSSQMLVAFGDKPGTIWGFEEVRQPYVQAAHETPKGKQPLRMLELWEAVKPATTDYATYEALLTDPDTAVRDLVAAGREKVEQGIAKDDPKFTDIKGHEDAYLAKFEQFATKFLEEFGQLMPKGTATRPKLDDGGTAKRSSLSEAAGIMPGGLMAGLACKAGLWWAKEEGAPVYYCLDGVNMADVTDYKKVKNKTIEEYIAAKAKVGAKPGDGEAHNEGVTMVELREILKNWEDLKGTIVFTDKGVIQKGDAFDAKVAQWREDMRHANEDAGRSPAPPKAIFTGELNKINTGLLALIPDTADGGRDARDIVRKFGYLAKVANTKPRIALNYLMSRCDVLVTYGIIHADLRQAAAELVMIDPDAPMGEMMKACAAVKAALVLCHADLQKPLEAALLRHPLMVMLERMDEH